MKYGEFIPSFSTLSFCAAENNRNQKITIAFRVNWEKLAKYRKLTYSITA